jgi:hypothetical protein
MNIRILQAFLSSLRAPLQSVGAERALDGLVAALEPYADWDLATFSEFLATADGYRRDGRVRIPAPEDAGLARLDQIFAAIRECLRQDPVSEAALSEAQEQAVQILGAIGVASGLTVTARPDKKWLDAKRAAIRAGNLANRLRALSSRITGPESYAAPEIQMEMELFATLGAADWKLVEPSLPTKLSGKGRAKVESALAGLSGHAPPAAAKKKPQKTTFTPDQVLPFVQKLKERMERSNDRDAFPRSEVDAQIAELEPLDGAMIRAILQEANFAVGARDSKPALLKKLREFLDAGHRAFERIQA